MTRQPVNVNGHIKRLRIIFARAGTFNPEKFKFPKFGDMT